jgi:hypothetical protein
LDKLLDDIGSDDMSNVEIEDGTEEAAKKVEKKVVI